MQKAEGKTPLGKPGGVLIHVPLVTNPSVRVSRCSVSQGRQPAL
jgi:hypothetical protein